MYYITTPIPYTNSDPHLGHLLEGVFVDTIARFQRRLRTDEVRLSVGLDQHGLKIYQKALENNQTPEEFVRHQSQKFLDLWQTFEIRYDVCTQTHSPEHQVIACLVWQKLADKGLIYKQTYQGLYCVGCEDFYAPSQLNDQGQCPVHLTQPTQFSEDNYFFRLSNFHPQIQEFLQTADIRPTHIAQEQLNFINQPNGLQDISISRNKNRLPWGIPTPDDPEQVMYVWFEALISYLTGCVNLDLVEAWQQSPQNYRQEVEDLIWSQISQALPINLMYASKEIAKFHLVIFPAMLMGLDLPLPETCLIHGLINDSQGRKFSKTLKNGVTPQETTQKLGQEATRFLLLHDINILGDTSFDWQHIIDSYNANLADNIGNLVVRASNLIEKFLDGKVNLDDTPNPKIIDLDDTYQSLAQLQTQIALQQLIEQATKLNQYLEKTKPWTLAKNGQEEELKEVLTACAYSLIQLGQALSIFLPQTGSQIIEIFTAETVRKAPIMFPKYQELEPA